ncbi:MAG: molecular chaperone TorD family protein, partial [Clostridia bacterium]|nr:molecular chaperone TorD family protein [Clostridia bacterium]
MIKKYKEAKGLAAFFDSLELWQKTSGAFCVKSSLTQIEYDDILKGTNASIFVPLWTSCAKTGTKLLCDENTLEVIRFYKKCGYKAVLMDGNPADYIGEELNFLAYIYACKAADPASFGDEANAFIDAFFTDTAKNFIESALTEDVKKWLSEEAYKELEAYCDLLKAFVSGDEIQICES